jgi:hypothetical protein
MNVVGVRCPVNGGKCDVIFREAAAVTWASRYSQNVSRVVGRGVPRCTCLEKRASEYKKYHSTIYPTIKYSCDSVTFVVLLQTASGSVGT